MDFISIIVAVASIIGVAITIISAWAQAEKQVADLYELMVSYRAAHPEVMRLGARVEKVVVFRPRHLARALASRAHQCSLFCEVLRRGP